MLTTLVIKPELLALSGLQLLYSQFRSAFKIENGKNIDWDSTGLTKAEYVLDRIDGASDFETVITTQQSFPVLRY